MATASKVQLSADVGDWPVFYRPGITKEQATKASTLLQENHEQHHIFFNPMGLHNHIVHHILAIWALNASPEALQKGYDRNQSYQRPQGPVQEDILKELEDPAKFVEYLGTGGETKERYHTFLKFFVDKIEESGWQKVLQKYLFAGDEQAEALLVRMYAGFLHPLIHLGYGIEFKQPAIIAEALAQAACHERWIGDFLLPAEKTAKERGTQPSKSLAQLLDEIHDDEKLNKAAHWDDGNKIRDGIIPRAGDLMVKYAAEFTVKPDELEEKTAEMTNAVCLYTAAAQHPPNMIMWDFYFMHCVNCSIFFPAFLNQDWISTSTKARLIEWKGRLDLAMYASRRCPEIRLDDEIRTYKPNKPSGWDGIMDRVCVFNDDGHSAKLVRALAHGQKICGPYEDKDEFRVKHDDWLQMGHMAIDSVEDTEKFPNVPHWARSVGFEEAWEKIPLRSQL